MEQMDSKREKLLLPTQTSFSSELEDRGSVIGLEVNQSYISRISHRQKVTKTIPEQKKAQKYSQAISNTYHVQKVALKT
jgi:hypothetical protein